MIHPQAAADPFCASLHRSFLISSFVCGGTALFVLPLHLALAGAPHGAVILVLSWMISLWPMALYLSRSGNLDRAVVLSSGLFACVVAAVCLMTGGHASFALAWMVVPPLEAALSTKRKTVVAITALCVLLLSVIVLQPYSLPQFAAVPDSVRYLSTLIAIIYAGLLAGRISQDRKRAQQAVGRFAQERQLVNRCASEVLCEIGDAGGVTVLGGPLRQMFSLQAHSGDEDWLFARIHVADRPLYLTSLSDVRHGGGESRFEVRMRVGASAPGESGQAEYRPMQLHLRTVAEEGSVRKSAGHARTLLSIRSLETSEGNADGFVPQVTEAEAGKVRRTLFQNANAEAQAAFAEIVALASRMETTGTGHEAAALIRRAGEDGIAALNGASELKGADGGAWIVECAPVDINTSLLRCADLLRPVCDQMETALTIEPLANAPVVLADDKLLRQALCLVLSEMLETSGKGGAVNVAGGVAASGLHIVMTVSNRRSCLSWSAEASQPVLRFANGLFERIGGKLSIQTMLGHGESIMLRLPLRGRHARPMQEAAGETGGTAPLKTAMGT